MVFTAHRLTLAMTLLLSTQAFALESLSDADLSQAVGKDGMTVTIDHGGTLAVDALRIIDQDGIRDSSGAVVEIDIPQTASTTDTVALSSPGGLSLNMGGDKQIKLCTNSDVNNCTTAGQQTVITMDTDGGSGNPFFNASIDTGAKAIIVPVSTVSLVSGTNTQGVWSSDLDIIGFSDGVKVSMTNALQANLQLGSQPQGAMLLVNGNTVDLDLGTMSLYSYNTASPVSGNHNSQITTSVSVDDLSYSGIAVNIDRDAGLVASMPGETTIAKIDILDTTFGTAGTAFAVADGGDGLSNASIGNLSIENVSITNLKIGITGM